jgi:hypothetical protein
MAADTIIAADCHMCAPHLWAERLDCRFCDRAPRVRKNPNSKKGPFTEQRRGLWDCSARAPLACRYWRMTPPPR